MLLINEFDYVEADPLAAVQLLQQNYLSVGQNEAAPVNYPYVYIAPSNMGIASGFDLDNNGAVVITGDQNADPLDGDSYDFAIRQLLQNPAINCLLQHPPASGSLLSFPR